METLFKYYSSKFDIIKHLKDPAIKLATTASLNDPFEMKLSKDLATKLSDKLLSLEHYKNLNARQAHDLRNELIKEYTKFSERYGIVSLSETHRNLLMWAHYGSSHKGVCVGYKTDLFEKKQNQTPLDKKINLRPQRIKYDSERFDIEYFYNGNKTIDILMQSIKTKSNEWIYEKEHRCIVPFSHGSIIKIKKQPNIELMNEILLCEKMKIITKEEQNYDSDFDSYTINKGSEEGLIDAMISKIAYYDDDAMVLKKIDLSSIDSIYLGCQYPKDATEIIVNMFRQEKEKFEHIKLYKYRVHEELFSLDLIPIENCKIKQELSKMITNRELDITHNSQT